MQSFNDPIDGVNAGSGGSSAGSSGTGGTTPAGRTGGLGDGMIDPAGTGGGTEGMSGSPALAKPTGLVGGTAGGGVSGGGWSSGTTPGGTTEGAISGSNLTGGTAGSGISGGGLSGTGGMADTGVFGGTAGGTDDFDLHEPVYRRHYTTVGTETAGTPGTYEEARTGYVAGHVAASNPANANRTYEEVEVELEREHGARFAGVREFARHAFEWKRVLAGVALVAGGYWASKKLFSAASELGQEEEQDCRTFYETHVVRSVGVPYSQARTVYVLGYVAARNPDYTGRAYDEVEPNLLGGYTGRGTGSYDALADFGRRGYERGSTRGSV